ncbi:MAG: HD domain-containing protein [archaeon]|nr:HD domain-containing protein [archaeon]
MADTRNLNAAMLYYIFNSANMHRWNDHFRVTDFTELDKQAHKAAIAWVLGKCEEDAGREVNWERIILHSLFSFIHRIAITDLKPPLYYKIIAKKENEADLNKYAFREFHKLVPDMDPRFLEEFEHYLNSEHNTKEDNILRVAHYLATRYEFDMIYPFNQYSYDIEKTRTDIEGQVYAYMNLDLAGVERLKYRSDSLYGFICMVGQLRCQQRWARTPREPKTSVLGHSIFVAIAAYLNDRDQGVTGDRLYYDYYSGLFHDLPEVLTKDVITPVKNLSIELPEDLGKIEEEMFEEKVKPLIPLEWYNELSVLALNPFGSEDGYDRDPDAVKACDQLAAWIEAFVSIRYGITSKTLREALEQTGESLRKGKGRRIGVERILEDFENMEI